MPAGRCSWVAPDAPLQRSLPFPIFLARACPIPHMYPLSEIFVAASLSLAPIRFLPDLFPA